MHALVAPTALIHELSRVNDGETDALSLRYVEISDSVRSDRSYGLEFLELVWLSVDGEAWKRNATITAARFQEGTPYRRWIEDLHFFDRVGMKAIVRVAEADNVTHKGYNVQRSWRLLSLRGDLEMTVLQRCSHPREAFAGSANSEMSE